MTAALRAEVAKLHAAKMKAPTIAGLIGRSPGWVQAVIEALEAPSPPPASAPPPAETAVTELRIAPHLLPRPECESDMRRPAATAARPLETVRAPASPPRVAARALTTEADALERLQAEVAWLRARLAEANAEDVAARLQGALGLTAHEARLLAVLWRRSPAVVRKDALWAALYADEIDGGPDPKILDVMVCKLRRKVEVLQAQLTTLWGQGYALTAVGRARVDAMLGGAP